MKKAMKKMKFLLKITIKSLLVWVQMLLKISIEVMKQNFNKNYIFIEMAFTY